MGTDKNYFVYLVTNKTNTVLYAGVTNNLVRRVYEHQHHIADGFTSRYRCGRLVHYELFATPLEAIEREKQIKSWSRRKKNELVDRMNPEWRDLSDTLR